MRETTSVGAWVGYAAVVAAKIGTTVWAAVKLPDQVATHFGASGAADGWGTRAGYVTCDIILGAVLLIGMPLLSLLASTGSGAGINIPHKDYWLRPENRPVLRVKLLGDLLFIGGAAGLLLVWIDIAVVRANLMATPAMGWPTWIVVGAFVVALLARSVWMTRGRYAVPA